MIARNTAILAGGIGEGGSTQPDHCIGSDRVDSKTCSETQEETRSYRTSLR